MDTVVAVTLGTTALAALAAVASAAIALRAVRAQSNAAAAQIAAVTNAAKLQSRASVVSASRQRWIDALRDDIADFLTADAEHKGFDGWPSSDPNVNLDSIRQKDRLLARKMLLLKRIRLRLNPKEADHNLLVARLNALVMTAQLESGLPAEEIVELTQKLLKTEWDRVKREASGDMDVSSPSF